MTRETDNESLLIRYLLGELDGDEQASVEERYFNDEGLFEQLLIAEDDLIDAYIRGDLTPESRKRFEEHFLRSPERRGRVDFALAWSSYISRSSLPEAESLEAARQRSFFARIKVRRGAAFAAIAALLLLAFGGSFLLVEMARLRGELNRARSERAALESKQKELEEEVEQERASREELAKRLEDELNRQRLGSVEPASGSSNAVVSFVLGPGLLRGSGESNTLAIPARTRTVRITLNFSRGDHSSYGAIIKTVDGAEVWRRTGLKPQRRGAIGSITLSLPADLLKEDDYILTLTGINAAGEAADVGEYTFRIARGDPKAAPSGPSSR